MQYMKPNFPGRNWSIRHYEKKRTCLSPLYSWLSSLGTPEQIIKIQLNILNVDTKEAELSVYKIEVSVL